MSKQGERAGEAWRRPFSPRNLLALALLTSAILLIRLPLWLLPGPGRDEAAYRYWAHHFEPAYSPLLQWVVRLFEFLNPHSLWALRGPVILLGLLALVLNDLRLRRTGAETGARWLAVLALALNPWQSYTGSILHPDGFLLVAMLGFVLAASRGNVLLAALMAVAALLAKPSGVLLLPVAWWMAGRMGCADRRRVSASRALLGLALLFFLISMKMEMLRSIADFGRMAPSVSVLSRLGAGGAVLLLLGGPLLIGLAFAGARERASLLHSRGSEAPPGARRREAEASMAAAVVLLLFFFSAALLRGQFKGNWILPAIVLLLPTRKIPIPRAAFVAGLAFAILASAGQTVALHRPASIGRFESVLLANGFIRDSGAYEVHAGVREKLVSSGRSWEQHLAQYGDLSGFAGQVAAAWRRWGGGAGAPAWILSDDYGLAAQLHWQLGNDETLVAIPGDGIFHRTLHPLLAERHPRSILVLSAEATTGEPWDRLEIIATLPELRHPVTGDTLNARVARLRRPPSERE